MTHEFITLIKGYKKAKKEGLKTVLATVVACEGSSYRRPGVRMLIDENGNLTGAVSGGCVEKEVVRQATPVFNTGKPVIMVYDGRYRLGCEGIIYILIEAFNPSKKFLKAFALSVEKRNTIKAKVYFTLDNTSENKGFTIFEFNPDYAEKVCSACTGLSLESHQLFSQNFSPVTRLVIIGAEHDAVKLCAQASLMGWEVWMVASETDPRSIANFPGASKLLNADATSLSVEGFGENTAVILMTHSFVRDLQYLHSLKDASPFYLGLLGPSARREKLLNTYLEHYPDCNTAFFDHIYGPAGLNLGTETPQEIAVSIIAEILSVMRVTKPFHLKDKQGKIHSNIKW